eukprot:2997236-Prymnesium_polylepis.1
MTDLAICGHVAHGGGGVLACLMRERLHEGFGGECKAVVTTAMMRSAADVRLMVSLRSGTAATARAAACSTQVAPGAR